MRAMMNVKPKLREVEYGRFTLYSLIDSDTGKPYCKRVEELACSMMHHTKLQSDQEMQDTI